MFEKIIGRSFEEARQLGWAYFTHPDDLEADLELFNQLSAGKIDYYELDKRFIRPDGSIVWVHIIVSRLVLAPNMKYNHICLVQDITERKHIEEQLIQSEHSKSILLSNLPGIAFRCQYKPDYNMEFVSEGCLNLTGFQSEAFIGNKDLSYRNIIAPEYRKTVWEQISYSVKSKTPINLEYEIVTASRERKWVLELGEAIYNDQGQAIALEGIIIDITDRKATETMLKYKNEHDTLTGLLNRNSLEKDLDCSFREEYAINQAVISINLNSIQALTALYGFHYSQNLILKVSEVLTQYQTYSRQIYRTYENRFAFYWKNYQNREDLEDFCRQLEVKLTSILTVERVSGGIGVVEITKEDRTNIDRLLQHALNASERAIEVSNREFQTHFFDKNLQKQIDREKYIDDEMMKCAQEKDDGGLYLVFQPIVDSKTQKINGFEALARLNTPKEGAISPNEFIPIAEKTKIINSLGKKIILQAFRFLKELGKKGFNDVYISINVSIIQLLRHDFVSSLFEMVEVEGVNPRLIGIELTETVFIHSFEVVNGILSKLQKAGFQIAIDDFGKGYSSLARERDLNIQYLKIDKFFIDQLLKGDIDKVITSDIISMA
ncbi:MAG: EAL domain-containing protein, partial [Bacilli bacterium]|nr:EAL domain-containing protein [Bacilli bacterium]